MSNKFNVQNVLSLKECKEAKNYIGKKVYASNELYKLQSNINLYPDAGKETLEEVNEKNLDCPFWTVNAAEVFQGKRYIYPVEKVYQN